MRILVVDDEKIKRVTLADDLATQGHEVVTAADGEAGLELYTADATKELAEAALGRRITVRPARPGRRPAPRRAAAVPMSREIINSVETAAAPNLLNSFLLSKYS